jgi:hypothetical protein
MGSTNQVPKGVDQLFQDSGSSGKISTGGCGANQQSGSAKLNPYGR